MHPLHQAKIRLRQRLVRASIPLAINTDRSNAHIMTNLIIRWCLDNRFLVLLMSLVVLGLGYYGLANATIDAIPDIGEKQVIVMAEWQGRSPQDVEDQ